MNSSVPLFLFSMLLISSTTPSLAARQAVEKGGVDGFNIPGFGSGYNWGNYGGGYGSGYGGPSGGHSGNGIIRPSIVCKEKGSCYNKKLTCPAKCFGSYSRSGKGYGGGGGGGGCRFDCDKKCTAYC